MNTYIYSVFNNGIDMTPKDFFARHPVFRAEEFGDFLAAKGRANVRTRDAHLRHYVQTGRLIRVRRPIYASVPYGHEAAKFQVDPYLVASRIAPGATLAYHAALQFRGQAHSVWNTYPVLVDKPIPALSFQDYTIRGVGVPSVFRRKPAPKSSVKTLDHQGLDVKACTLERTLVDCLDRPDLGGDWEEVWKSFAGVPYLRLDAVVEYALALGKAIVAAKTGYFLGQNRGRWDVEDRHLDALKKSAPKNLTYLDLAEKGRSSIVAEWNLEVPLAIQQKSWEEPE
jgi:predicted transcriptional regulator of viral defense system